jgi:hypothetical protein
LHEHLPPKAAALVHALHTMVCLGLGAGLFVTLASRALKLQFPDAGSA